MYWPWTTGLLAEDPTPSIKISPPELDVLALLSALLNLSPKVLPKSILDPDEDEYPYIAQHLA